MCCVLCVVWVRCVCAVWVRCVCDICIARLLCAMTVAYVGCAVLLVDEGVEFSYFPHSKVTESLHHLSVKRKNVDIDRAQRANILENQRH